MKTVNALVSKAHEMDARRIALLVQKAGSYEADIRLKCEGRKMNAKSLMGMLSMQLDPARPVVITAEGADEAAACEAMEEYIRSQM